MEDAHFRTAEEVLSKFQTNRETGLSRQQVEQNRRKWGRNELPPPARTSWFALIIKQFEDLLVLILLGSAVISLILGFLEEKDSYFEIFIEPSVILLILIANAIVGVWQESSAEEAIEKLKEFEAKSATVIRDGKTSTIDRHELVPGDLVKLAVGEKIPADVRVVSFSSRTFRADESMLTGESASVSKSLEVVSRQATSGEIVDQEKHNVLFSGTLVVHGNAVGVVVLTGGATSMGQIQEGLMGDDEQKTPLGQKLDEFAEFLSKVILAICVLVWVINIGHFDEHGGWFAGSIYYFKIAVALAVAAIPEGLPAVVTTCLALGTMKMAKKNAIVRSLPSVETLGCTTVICSDKTGTLTTNQMSVKHVMTVTASTSDEISVSKFDVSGTTYEPRGDVTTTAQRTVLRNPSAENESLKWVAKIASMCNESKLTFKRVANNINWQITGEPTEGALKVLAEKLGVPSSSDDNSNKDMDIASSYKVADDYWHSRYAKQHTFEFTRERKSMSVVAHCAEKKLNYLLVKGAPESLLDRSTSVLCNDGAVVALDARCRQQIDAVTIKYASMGLRCLGLAYAEMSASDLAHATQTEDYASVESKLTYVGTVAMQDPPRTEVKEAIRVCNQAGIRVIVITGDNIKTAEAVCRDIGLFEAGEDLNGKSYLGSEFMALSPQAQNEAILRASLFSRVMPWHKGHIVELLQKQGDVVAMTGDGVNDAPALKKADIGIGMGSGTQVARHSSDMILADDNFATIVSAVEEGRAIYANTKQFIRYLISSNIGEVACIFLTAALGLPEALIPVQLLWVNLVTDGLPATALGFNKADQDIMQHPPRGRTEKIIDGWMFFRYLLIGLYVGVATVLGFVWWFMYYESGPRVSWGQLSHFHSCGQDTANGRLYFGAGDDNAFDCSIFADNRASTVSLSILVTIEMFNTFNALSENQSLLVNPPWSNIWVVLAVTLSMLLHCMILYVPFFRHIFSTAASNTDEWVAVILISFPVIVLDEILKFISRQITARSKAQKTKTE
eukprot:CAMPEP_0202704156 /NCGR_PEP_ID=MMETSP1385-20130828/16893_1 /ASSEMBLY_ACC=CAM_ASM_000861 /TAXON_ID=933848 /ORGANISM="Elphidium margaritaceum" /LENGTH=1015 /DNA_ID=CAMNT_0049362121 /DNA_START=63 /DNA_END=3113 /DNA_ORIENTATION=-